MRRELLTLQDLTATDKGDSMATVTYIVDGMTCGHCVSSVTEEVGGVASVTDVDADLATGEITVTSTEPVDDAAVRAAVAEVGYTVRG